MKFAINRYNVGYRIVKSDPLSISEVKLEVLPFGIPRPFELREIWTLEISRLEELLSLIEYLGIAARVSLSPYWLGDMTQIGKRLFGISLLDDPDHDIDPRDRPIWIRP
jgi:hypothetical protein